MPALPSVNFVAKCTLKYTDGGDRDLINQLFFRFISPGDASDLDSICDAIATAWGAHMKSLQTSSAELSEVHLIDLTSDTSPVGAHTGVIAGTRSGTPLNGGSAFIVSHKINRRYRGGHPRTYFPIGVAADLDTPQSFSPTFQGLVVTGWTAFIAAVLAIDVGAYEFVEQVNVSYYKGFTNRTMPSGREKAVPTLRTTPMVDSIVGYGYVPTPGSQRRRNRAH